MVYKDKIKLDIQRFAISGQMNTPANEDGTYFYVSWSRQSYSIENNTSTIYWQIGINARYSYYSNAVSLGQTVINGVVVHGGGTYSNISSGLHTLFEGTLVIPHNNDGTKSFGISTSGWTWGCSWVSGSGTYTLNTIPRATKVNNIVGDNVEESFTVNLTKYYSKFTQNLTMKILDGNEYFIIREIENFEGGELQFNEDELQNIFDIAYFTNEPTIVFELKTYNGQTLIGTTTYNFNFNIYDANPIFNNYSFEDSNTVTLALTGNKTYFISGYTTLKIFISTNNRAIGNKGAYIEKYRIGNIDIPYKGSSLTTNIPNFVGGTINLYAIDSRGNSTLVTKQADRIINYEPLYLDANSIKVERTNNGVGNEVKLNFSGKILNDNFGAKNNTFTKAKYYFKKANEEEWQEASNPTDIRPTIGENGEYNFNGLIKSNNADYSWDLDSSYIFKIELEDYLSNVSYDGFVVASAIPHLSFDDNGVGIMCAYDRSKGGLLQVGGESLEKYNISNQIKFYYTNTTTLNLTPEKDCLCEVDGISTTWGYDGGQVTVSLQINNSPTTIFNYNGIANAGNTVARDVSCKAVYQLTGGVSYRINLVLNNSGGNKSNRIIAKTYNL